MSILARQQASSSSRDSRDSRNSLFAALFPQQGFPQQGSRASSGAERLARQQLWLEVPTFVGVFAAVLGALFL